MRPAHVSRQLNTLRSDDDPGIRGRMGWKRVKDAIVLWLNATL
jgi:hypothetical protein